MKHPWLRYILLIYFCSVLASGVFYNPGFALIGGLLYTSGFAGLMLVRDSAEQEGSMRYGYLALGITLIACCCLWLEMIWSLAE